MLTEYSGDEIKKNEMGGTCGTNGRQEKCIQGFGEGDLRERDHVEDLGVDGVNIKVDQVDWGGGMSGLL
jgi:hypothetical protein